MKNILKIVFVIIGTLVGAGFASGQEIYMFFYAYGTSGIIGIIISSILMGIVIYKTLQIVSKKEVKDYKTFLDEIIKIKTTKKQLNIKNITNIIINLFVLITFFIMIAGFGAYFQEQLGINKLIGSSILASLCFFVFKKHIEGVVKVNTILVPILIILISIIGIISLNNISPDIVNELNKSSTGNWLISSISYSGYNIILLIPVLITLEKVLQKNKKSKKQTLKIAIITTTIIILLELILFSILLNVGENIKNIEMPVAFVVTKISYVIQIIYGVIILFSIFTTSVALGNSFLMNINKNKTKIAVLICICSVIFSNIGFSNLISSVYPVFGILGLIQIFQICKYKIKVKKI